MKIAVDMDDVVVDFYSRVVKCYNTEFGEKLQLSDITGWDDNPVKLSPFFGEGKVYPSWWAWWEDRAWLWGTCDVMDGAIGGLTTLHNAGHYIELLTSKPHWARRFTTEWLAKWHPYFDSLTIVDETSKQPKWEVTDATLLIDDRPSNIEAWIAQGRQAILFDRPWNQDAGLPADVPRAHDWYDVVRLVVPTMKEAVVL